MLLIVCLLQLLFLLAILASKVTKDFNSCVNIFFLVFIPFSPFFAAHSTELFQKKSIEFCHHTLLQQLLKQQESGQYTKKKQWRTAQMDAAIKAVLNGTAKSINVRDHSIFTTTQKK